MKIFFLEQKKKKIFDGLLPMEHEAGRWAGAGRAVGVRRACAGRTAWACWGAQGVRVRGARGRMRRVCGERRARRRQGAGRRRARGR